MGETFDLRLAARVEDFCQALSFRGRSRSAEFGTSLEDGAGRERRRAGVYKSVRGHLLEMDGVRDANRHARRAYLLGGGRNNFGMTDAWGPGNPYAHFATALRGREW